MNINFETIMPPDCTGRVKGLSKKYRGNYEIATSIPAEIGGNPKKREVDTNRE